MSYNSKHKSSEIEGILDSVGGKADDTSVVHKTGNETISGAKTFNNGVNFVGNGDSNAVTLSTNTRINVNGTNQTVLGFGSGSFYINHSNYNLLLRGKATRPTYNGADMALYSDLSGKQDKVSGKGLSTEDFTTALKTKLEGLSNYDDTTLANAISGLETRLNTLVSGDASTAIESFNEIMAFLDGIKDTQDLSSIIASIEQQIAAKQDKITDLDTIRSGAAKGATALQSYTEKYTGTITGITMNGASKGTSGVVNLGTVITEHQDISGKADKSSLATVATSGSYNDLSNKPTIPAAVTESTVSGWGFTKNTGTYSKPSTGIPKTDLATAVQTSLGKADTALQEEVYKGTIEAVDTNESVEDPELGYATTQYVDEAIASAIILTINASY